MKLNDVQIHLTFDGLRTDRICDGVAVEADRAAPAAAALDRLLRAVVACLAQALPLAVPEQVLVASMWLHVVTDRCRGYASGLRAHAA